jgi:hypothetical protein
MAKLLTTVAPPTTKTGTKAVRYIIPVSTGQTFETYVNLPALNIAIRTNLGDRIWSVTKAVSGVEYFLDVGFALTPPSDVEIAMLMTVITAHDPAVLTPDQTRAQQEAAARARLEAQALANHIDDPSQAILDILMVQGYGLAATAAVPVPVVTP